MQVMCRAGKKGIGSTHAFKYKNNGDAAGAGTQAEAWLCDQKKKPMLIAEPEFTIVGDAIALARSVH